MSDFLELSRTLVTNDREALHASFKDNVWCLERELQCSKRAEVMHTIKLWAYGREAQGGKRGEAGKGPQV